MPKKKSKKAPKKKKPEDPKIPPLHELWDLTSLHTTYEEGLSEIGRLKNDRQRLEAEISELKNDHSVVYEKFQEEFDRQKESTLALVAKAAESGDIRKASEEKNAAKIKELESFVKTARHTVTKISAEWKAKLSLIREAETAVVRNAQLEIENSQLNREKTALKEELKKRESQIFVIQKAGVGFNDDTSTQKSTTLQNYSFKSNQEGNSEIVRGSEDISVALSPMILEAMKQFPDSSTVQSDGVIVISELTKTFGDCEVLGKFFGIELVMRGMRNFLDLTRMQVAGSKLLWRLSSLNDSFFRKVLDDGGIAMTLCVMRRNPHDMSRSLVYNCMRLLKILTAEHEKKLDADGLDSLFKIEGEGRPLTGPKPTKEELKKMFPRVNRKRERLAEEAERRKGKRREAEDSPKNGLITLPPLKGGGGGADWEAKKKNKRGIVSKRRSLLLLGTDQDVEGEDEQEGEENGGEAEGADSVGLSLMGALQVEGTPSNSVPSSKTSESLPPVGEGKIGGRQGEFFAGNLVSEGRSVMKTLLVTLSYCIEQMKAEEDGRDKVEAMTTSAGGAQGFLSGLLSDDPSSSSPSMVGHFGGGRGSVRTMHKVTSMPVMGKHAVFVRPGQDHGGEEVRSDDDSDYGEDSVESYKEEDDFTSSGRRRKKGRRGKKGKGAQKTKEQEDEEEITSNNPFKQQSYADTARDCLVNCILAMDADGDSGCAAVVGYKSAQKIIVEALGACRDDQDAVAAACMLIRGSLKSGAKQRMKQTAFVIECGLSDTISDVLRIHDDQKMYGKVMDECQAMIEGLGNQFERTLTLVQAD